MNFLELPAFSIIALLLHFCEGLLQLSSALLPLVPIPNSMNETGSTTCGLSNLSKFVLHDYGASRAER